MELTNYLWALVGGLVVLSIYLFGVFMGVTFAED